MRVMALCVALLVPGPAFAQTLDLNAMVHQGVELRRAHRDLEALEVFQQAWMVSRAPRVLAQIGFAELALGRWVDAEAHLVEALDAERDPWITEHRGLVEEALRDVGRHVGSLDVRANVPGAEVRVEGRRVGALPFTHPARVAAGTTTLEVSAPGHLPIRRSIVVGAGSLTRESVTLLGADAWTLGSLAPTDAAVRGGREPGSTQRVLAWAAAGGAVLGLGIGVAALVVRNDAAARWNSNACLVGGQTRQQNCGDEESTATTAGGISVGGFVTGAVLAISSVVLFATAPARGGRPVASAFGCGVGPGAVGITCGGSL